MYVPKCVVENPYIYNGIILTVKQKWMNFLRHTKLVNFSISANWVAKFNIIIIHYDLECIRISAEQWMSFELPSIAVVTILVITKLV